MVRTRYDVAFVYVLTNPSMPGIVKVGKTSWLSEDRAQKLFTTGVPEPFDVAFRLETSWPGEVERRAHDSLDEYRVHPKREFFRISTAEAIDAVRGAAVAAGGIACLSGGPIIRLERGDRLALTLEKGQTFALMSFPNIVSRSADVNDLWQAHSDGDLLEILTTASGRHVASFADGHPAGSDDPVPYLDRDQDVVNGMINGKEHLVTGDRLLWFAPPTEDHPAMHVLFEAGTYCQIVSRTWSPVPGFNGRARLLNEWITQPSQELAEAIREALTLPIPNRWAPRNGADRDGWEQIGLDTQPPEYWLPQLKKRRTKQS